MRGGMLITTACFFGSAVVCLLFWLNYSQSVDPSFVYLLDGIVIVNNSTSFTARPATFGPLPPVLGSSSTLEGPLKILDGPGCSTGDLTGLNDSIALVVRGGCSFYQKVQSLQSAGAKAVIVGNNIDSNLISMYTSGDPTNVFIPSVFVNRAAFAALQEHEGKTIKIALLPQAGSVISSMILFILSPLLSISLVYAALAFQRYRDKVKLRAPQQVVDALPVLPWDRLDHNPIAIRDCAICLEDFDKTSTVMILPCGHGFHPDCISRWLLRERRLCPICRHEVTEPLV